MEELVEQFANPDFLFTAEVVRKEAQSVTLFQLLDKRESLKLDIYPRELIRSELQRSQSLEIFECLKIFAGVFLPVVSRIDEAISKHIWISKGSHRSRRDFRSIFSHCNQEQQSSIREAAAEMHLALCSTKSSLKPMQFDDPKQQSTAVIKTN